MMGTHLIAEKPQDKEAVIQFSLPHDMYEQAKEILSQYGLKVEDAVVLLYRYIVANGGLPF